MINAYPLCWPTDWPRTPSHHKASANFKRFGNRLSIADGVSRVFQPLRQMGCRDQDIIVSTNVRTNSLGLPRSDQRMPDDCGVAVYWQSHLDKTRKVIAIDQYDKVADNLAAIAATLDAMRAIERHGGARILERAFTGFTALLAPGQTSRGWRQVFGVDEDCSLPLAEAAYKILRSRNHPDKNPGDHEAATRFDEIQKAYEQACAEFQQ